MNIADLDFDGFDEAAVLRVHRAFLQHPTAGLREYRSTHEQLASAAITRQRAEARAIRDAERQEHALRAQLERQQ